MMHPLNPAHPQYPTLVAAGRVRERTFGTTTRDELACWYQHEGRHGVELCQQPAVYTVRRVDGIGVSIRLCDRDVRNYTLGTFVVARVSCSSCDVDAKRYELDESGRCDECRP